MSPSLRKRSFNDLSGNCNDLHSPPSVEMESIQINKRQRLQEEWFCGGSTQHERHQTSRGRPGIVFAGGQHTLTPNVQMKSATRVLFSELDQRIYEDPIAIVSRTLDILALSHGDMTVRMCCCQTLKALTPLLLLGKGEGPYQQQQEDFYHDFAVNTLLACMKRHLGSSLVQLEAGKILQRLLAEESYDKSAAENGNEKSYCRQGVMILSILLECYPDDVTLQCLFFDLIRRFKHSNSQQAHWVDSTHAILRALDRHPSVAYIQQIGLSLVAWLAEDGLCREVLVQGNGVGTIPEVMKMHIEDSLIQCNAAAALCWLIHAGGHTGRCRLDPKYIPTVVEVLERHQDNPSAFGNCVCLLCGLSETEINVGQLLNIVLKGMENHLDSAKVQEGCLRWIRFRDPEEFCNEFIDAIPTVLSAIRLHPEDAHLQAQAAEVLSVFAGVESLREALLEKGAVDVVLNGLKRHRHDCRVQQGAVWFLTLSMRPQESTIAFGGGFDVMEVIWRSLGIGENETEEESQPVRGQEDAHAGNGGDANPQVL